MVVVTETIRGDKIGKRANDWYARINCPQCGESRLILRWKLKLPNFTGLCLKCNGKLGGRWNNGMMRNSAGYVYTSMPEHPEANAHGYVRRSHLVLEQKLGRRLRDGCVAHHLNGINDDDRPKNLIEILNIEHPTLHVVQRKLIKESKKEVVEIVRDWETIPSEEFNRKYKVKLIDNTEDETLLEIIERYLGIGKPSSKNGI